MRNLHCILMVICVFGLTLGCSNPFGNEGSSVDTNYGPNATLPAPSGFGVVSGSNQGAITTLNRKAQISVGTAESKIILKTSLNRSMYVSVQGQIISK